MKILSLLCVLTAAFGTAAFSKAPRTKAATAHHVRQVPPIQVPPMAGSCWACFVGSQDLFDRNDPNNLRSDYPSPPAQPAQF
jgi:hypothetical protein